MTTRTSELFLLEDLDDPGRTGALTEAERGALRSVAAWITDFIVQPHPELGRAGSVCPFVPTSIERKVHWLAAEQVAGRSVPDVVEVMNGHRRRLLDARRSDGDGTVYDVIVVVFTDLEAERAPALFGDVLQQIASESYVEDGIVFGPFHDGHPGTAIYNSSFRPFQSPVPFLFVRHGVVDDWKFFLDDDDWLARWGRRFGESAVKALGAELRRMPWRAGGATGE